MFKRKSYIKIFSILLITTISIPNLLLAQETTGTGNGYNPATDDALNQETNWRERPIYQIDENGNPDFTSDEVSDEVNYNKFNTTYPEQDKPAPTGAASAGADTGKCILSNVAASLGAKLFGGFVDNMAAVATNPNLVPVIDVLNTRKEVGAAGGVGPSYDAIGYCIINSVIQYISDATIDWINNGFDGNPVFVDDPAQMFRDIGKDTLNAFIDGIGDGILCERFSEHITFAIVRNFKSNRKVVPDRCTLEEASANIDRFMSGEDFSFEMMDVITSNPNNNVIGAYAMAESKLGKAVIERLDVAKMEQSWGDGFLSWKDKTTGKTVTPGSYIGLNSGKVLGMSMDRLVLADEFDEIVTALVNQLIKTALNEVLGDGETKSWTGKTSI